MNRRFYSKVDTWLIVVLIAAFIVSIISTAPAFYQGMWWVAVPVILIFGFVIWIFSSTYYVIGERDIVVRSGPFRWRIPIDEIEDIQPTRNPLSSAALSLDRLNITYSGGRWMMISPKDKEGFLAELERVRR
ncbi:MAG TPA: PH domain-containing protein [Pyrinomonadaceae bacterium]|nr:PH domain-containing protein [Pyrinomonadaceae bacterium]HMP66465.1 PH domain-containing protein [Pyrinomonadaceae bacterium]